ncbi:MAG: hypothetical protein U1F14_00490 [Steroidobacteraceae bacterium]
MREQQRELSRRQRASARSLGSAFPQVENVRIELTFEAPAGRDPARQSHMLYPAAPAYFRFDCPLGDCDGGFDLNAAALSLLEHASELGDGTLQCRGSRPGAAMSRQPCGLYAHYRIAVRYADTGSSRT